MSGTGKPSWASTKFTAFAHNQQRRKAEQVLVVEIDLIASVGEAKRSGHGHEQDIAGLPFDAKS